MTHETEIITIIGAGFTGSSIAAQQARLYAALAGEGRDLPPLTIRLVDATGTFGPGLPYATNDDIFLLNQPAGAMSPFPDDPDHFTRWLHGTGDEFATRRQYGVYLKETLTRSFQDAAAAHAPIRLETLSCRVTALAFDKVNITLQCDDGAARQTQSLILATGHEKSIFLSGLADHPRFFSAPPDVEKIREAIQTTNENDRIGIVGTGQSMMDFLAALDHAGYKGKITALSRELAQPWLYDPADYRDPRKTYTPYFLDPVRVQEKKIWSASGLSGALRREFVRASKQGFTTGHVLAAIDFNKLEKAGADGNPPMGLIALRHLWSAIYGNPTPPQRYELFRRWRKSGRLDLARAEINEKNIEKPENGFILHGVASQGDLKLSALFNAAAFARDSLSSPLLAQAAAQGVLRIENHSIVPGRQLHDDLYVGGPPANPGKWGVETFRSQNAEIARLSIEKVLNPTSKKP
jgi:hypothetical protein